MENNANSSTKSEGKYSLLVADPAWRYKAGRKTHTSAEQHYETMELDEICGMPVSLLAEDRSLLFLWATAPLFPEATKVMAAWGFTYVTVAFTWVKVAKSGSPLMGVGYYTRSNAEFVLLGKKGSIKPTRRDIHSIVMCERQKHSAKPEVVQSRIERMYEGQNLKKLELFARRHRDGWDCSGIELTGHDYRTGNLI